jgi:hypothetical protein
MSSGQQDAAEPLGPVEIDVNVGWPTGSENEVLTCPRDEWNAMTPAERAQWCDAEAEGYALNRVNWGWNVAGPDGDGL